jgi:6-phosphogluconolactonase (cycloisomerase 2 family)
VKASPSTDILIATDGGSTNNFRTFVINPSTGALTNITTTVGSGPLTPSAIAYNAPLNASIPPFYIANTGSNNFTANSVAPDGTIGFTSQIVSDSTGPVDLAVDPSGKFLYVANNGSGSVNAFLANINGSNFTTVFIASVAAGAGPQSIAVVGHP